MSKFFSILFSFIITSIVFIIIFVIYIILNFKSDKSLLLYYVLTQYSHYIYIISALPILYNLIFISEKDQGNYSSKGGFVWSIFLYIIIIFSILISINEFLLPSLMHNISYKNYLLENNIKKIPALTNFTDNDFLDIEINNLPYLESLKNPSFYFSDIVLYGEKLYKLSEDIYYIKNPIIINYDIDREDINYFITSDYGKFIDDELILKNCTYNYVKKFEITKSVKINENKKIPFPPGGDAVYVFNNLNPHKMSLKDLFIYNRLFLDKKTINLTLNNYFFIRILNYIIFLIYLIIVFSFSIAYRNKAIVKKEIFQSVSFIILSVIFTAFMMNLFYNIIDFILILK